MIKTAVDVLFDKRFGLANFIMNNYLRNYLAVDNIPIDLVVKYSYKNKPQKAEEEIKKVQDNIQSLMRM